MRLVTFNILHGRSPSDDSVDPSRLVAAVRQLDPDVLALQEVDHLQQRSHAADLTALAAEAMGAVDHRFVATLSGAAGATWIAATGEEQPDSAAYGLALLSRYPVSSWGVVRLPVLRRRLPLLFPGRRRPVLVRDEPRAAVVAEVEGPSGRLTVVNTHLSFIQPWNRTQLRRLVDGVADRPRPLMLVGDLNMEPRPARRATRMRSLVEDLTFPVDRPDRQIDHVLLDGSLPQEGVRGAAVQLPLSDHRALVVDLPLSPGPPD